MPFFSYVDDMMIMTESSASIFEIPSKEVSLFRAIALPEKNWQMLGIENCACMMLKLLLWKTMVAFIRKLYQTIVLCGG